MEEIAYGFLIQTTLQRYRRKGTSQLLLLDVVSQAPGRKTPFIHRRYRLKPGFLTEETAEPLPGKFDKDVLRGAGKIAEALLIFPVFCGSSTSALWADRIARDWPSMDHIPVLVFLYVYDLPARQIE